jgi:hypothetical protein
MRKDRPPRGQAGQGKGIHNYQQPFPYRQKSQQCKPSLTQRRLPPCILSAIASHEGRERRPITLPTVEWLTRARLP